MILIEPPPSLKEYLNRFLFEPADSATLANIRQGLSEFYPDEHLKLYVGYDYYGYLDIRFEFESIEDVVIFKLRHAYGL